MADVEQTTKEKVLLDIVEASEVMQGVISREVSRGSDFYAELLQRSLDHYEEYRSDRFMWKNIVYMLAVTAAASGTSTIQEPMKKLLEDMIGAKGSVLFPATVEQVSKSEHATREQGEIVMDTTTSELLEKMTDTITKTASEDFSRVVRDALTQLVSALTAAGITETEAEAD